VLVEGVCRSVDAVEDHGDEGEGLAGVETVAEGLGEEQAPEPLALRLGPDAEPCENYHGQLTTRESADGFVGKVGEIDLASG
jgi:hypothetical protein